GDGAARGLVLGTEGCEALVGLLERAEERCGIALRVGRLDGVTPRLLDGEERGQRRVHRVRRSQVVVRGLLLARVGCELGGRRRRWLLVLLVAPSAAERDDRDRAREDEHQEAHERLPPPTKAPLLLARRVGLRIRRRRGLRFGR